MAAQPSSMTLSPAAFVGKDLGYHSDIWNGARFSQALIIPFVGRNEGFAALDTIINAGYRDAEAVLISTDAAIADLDRNLDSMYKIRWHLGHLVVHLCRQAGCTSTRFTHPLLPPIIHPFYQHVISCHVKYHQHVEEGFLKTVSERQAAEKFRGAVSELLQQFGTLRRVAGSLVDLYDKYGVNVMVEWEGVIKTIICIKCLDSAWEKMRGLYKEVRKMEAEIKSKNICDFPLDNYAAWNHATDQAANKKQAIAACALPPKEDARRRSMLKPIDSGLIQISTPFRKRIASTTQTSLVPTGRCPETWNPTNHTRLELNQIGLKKDMADGLDEGPCCAYVLEEANVAGYGECDR